MGFEGIILQSGSCPLVTSQITDFLQLILWDDCGRGVKISIDLKIYRGFV